MRKATFITLEILCVLLASFCIATAQSFPYTVVPIDVQKRGQQFTIDREYYGSTPFFKFVITDNGSAFDTTGWDFSLKYGYSRNANALVSFSGTNYVTVTNNEILVNGTTNFFFEARDNYYMALQGTHSSGASFTFAEGNMDVEYTPAGDPNVLDFENGLTFSLVLNTTFNAYTNSADLRFQALETQTNLIQSAVQPTDATYTQTVALAASALQSYTETDPVFSAWDKSAGVQISESQVTNLQSYLTAESDPAWHSGTGAIYSAIDLKQDASTAATDAELLVVSNRVDALDGRSNAWNLAASTVSESSNVWNLAEGAVQQDGSSFYDFPLEITVSGAGTADANGTYDYDSIFLGCPRYIAENGYYVRFGSVSWEIMSGASIKYWNDAAAGDLVPTNGWYRAPAGSDPAPSVALGDIPNAAAFLEVIGAVSDGYVSGVTLYDEPDFTVGVALWGQSNAEGFPGWTNRLFSSAFTANSNAWISYVGQYTATDTNSINYQTNLVYYDYTYNDEISWSVELPVGTALTGAAYDAYIYKTAIGGASPNSFTNGGTWWSYVTNTYAAATALWSNAPPADIVIFMRGETGSDTQTQEQSYAERLATYQSATNFYGNSNLQFIMTGLPGNYYTNACGPAVEAGARQLADENPNCWFVETHDLAAGHYDQDQMLEVGNRIVAVISKILAGKRHAENEQFDNLGVTDLVADQGQFRELNVGSYPFAEAVEVVLEDAADSGSGRGYDAMESVALSTLFNTAAAPVYSNNFRVVCRFDADMANAVAGGPAITTEDIALQGGFDYRFGDWVTMTNPALDSSASFTDLSITNNDFFIAYWYRREFTPSAGDTTHGFAFYFFNSAGNNPGIGISTRQYVAGLGALNYTPCLTMTDSAGTTRIGSALDGFIDYAAPLNEWHHYAWTVDRNGTSSVIKCYVDGLLNKTWTPAYDMSSTPAPYASWPACGIGARRRGTASEYECDGSIAEFMYGQRVLNAKEIMSLATGQPIKGVE